MAGARWCYYKTNLTSTTNVPQDDRKQGGARRTPISPSLDSPPRREPPRRDPTATGARGSAARGPHAPPARCSRSTFARALPVSASKRRGISGRRLFRRRLGDRVTPDAFISPSRGQGNVLARCVKAEASGSDYGLDSGTLATATRVLQPPGLSGTQTRGCGAHQAAGEGTILPAPRKGLWPAQVFKHPTRAHRPPTTLRLQN